MTQIGFKPPEPPAPPRKWRFDIDGCAGNIEETITPNKIYGYAWVAESGNSSIGILKSDRPYSYEELEARLRARLKAPGLAAHA
jgi:hypothetical protein